MAVVTIGTTGCTWGLTAETGILVQSYGYKTQREKNQVRNESGDFVLVAFYNPTASLTISGVLTGGTGVAAASPGVTLSIANSTSYGGVSSGGIYTDDVDVQGTNTEFRKITVNATRYPSIT